ncbi:MAG: ribosome maturation factor RimP [Gammaproteobacteria bacterium]|nr:ribosome maturation factor RimP [Gammaproteobacteria bacterium]
MPHTLQNLVEPVVTSMGYDFVGLEVHSQPQGSLLRIYIDKDDGITADDCQRVSHQVSGVLEVEEPISGNYTLEISSPGLDRPLFTEEHFKRFAGNDVKIRVGSPVDGRRKFTGRLQGVDEEHHVVVRIDEQEFHLLLANIEQARLVPQY